MAKKWFGDNWRDYVNKVSDRTLEETKKSLLAFLPEEEWKGKTMIDIGCGSGMFSLSALLLGAKKVISIDIDPKSIEATNFVREKFRSRAQGEWMVVSGSILDRKFAESLKGQGDIVYAWGSLHHTGDMKTALENAYGMVGRNGRLILAIYNHTASSESWLGIKKRFDSLPDPLKVFIEIPYASALTFGYMIRRRTLNINKDRGMDVFHDAVDWLRGYPYEFRCSEDMIAEVEAKGFRLVKAPTALPCGKGRKANVFEVLRAANVGCNEFVFARK